MNKIVRLYSLLVCLYPRKFQAEFADEMHSVFADAVADAARRGNHAVFAFCAREVYDLPVAILREHWRERDNVEARTNEAMRFEHVSWSQVVAATVPFLMLLVLSLLNVFQMGGSATPVWLRYIFLTIIVLPFLIGLLRGIPRWCLPYLGMFAALASLIMFLNVASNLQRPLSLLEPWIVQRAIQAGFPWLGLIALIFLFVMITLVLPPLRLVYARIRQDWTLLSFSLYGAMVHGLELTFEDYPPVGRGGYEIAGSLILAVGAWAYLRNSRMRRRALVLFVSVVLTMTVATIGKALLAASPVWPFPGTPDWQAETLGTVIDGVWMLIVILLVPALTNLLPRPSQSSLSA